MPDASVHPIRSALGKFWAPVPWMLEAVIVIELALRDFVEAAVIAVLLIFNAVLSFLQESHAQATLAALKSRLPLTAAVRRDGRWKTVPAPELVAGDVVKLSLGAVVAADVRLLEGSVLLDQSMLTGESVPIEGGPGLQTYAGALTRRGEAVAEVTATGTRTKFGKTAELVRAAHVTSTQQKVVLRVVRNLAIFNSGVIVLLAAYALVHAMPLREMVPLLLTAILSSIPVALPATFTLAAAIGAKALAKLGVLPTRLSAVDEAATMDTLCVDKTGTLTQNALSVTVVRALDGSDEARVLGLAALASSDGGQDSVDAAIRAAATRRTAADLPALTRFVPFDPATKMSEAEARSADGTQWRIVKGAFSVVRGLAPAVPDAQVAASELEAKGYRVLALAAGPEKTMRLAGLIALSDPPRADSGDSSRSCAHWECVRSWSRAMRLRQPPSSPTRSAWTGRFARPVRSRRGCGPTASRSLQVSFPRTSSIWCRSFKRAVTQSACAATGPTTPRLSVRLRWGSRSRQRPMSPSPRRESC